MWRLLEKGEVTRHDDEYWSADRWRVWGEYHGGNPLVMDVPVRRWAGEKKAVEPVRVGDRVEVVSGTWAKSCGVVLGILPMNLKIKLDNVFVGGSPLVFIVGKDSVRSAQKCAPKSVQVDPEWRLLAIGEVIREGDEWITPFENRWRECRTSVGYGVETHRKSTSCKTFQARRRVRIESPGWRYLDAGETVQAGDEYASCRWRWDIQQKSTGRVVSSSESFHFRRKTTPFAG